MTMAHPLRSTPPVLIAAIIILIRASVICAWIPRFSTARSRGDRVGGNGVRQQVLLSASNTDDDNKKIDEESDLPSEHDFEGEILPLFAGGNQFNAYISQLEAIYDMDSDSDFYVDKTDTRSQRLLEDRERVALGDWMEWEEGRCLGDSCGDEFDVSRAFSASIVNLN